jgi:hypothetical protein
MAPAGRDSTSPKGEAVATLVGRCSKGEKPSEATCHRLAEIGTIAEIQAHESLLGHPIAGGNGLASGVHEVGIECAGNAIDALELVVGAINLVGSTARQRVDEERV